MILQEMEHCMFNGNFRHPLDNLIKDDRLFMMEAILPFVDDNMKAPLAMYIKIMELQAIIRALQDKDYVSSCGLHKDINNQDDILSSLACCGFPDVREQFSNMKKYMDMAKVMSSMESTPQTPSDPLSTDPLYSHYQDPVNGQESEPDSEPVTSDLYGSIMDLFDEYDRKGY